MPSKKTGSHNQSGAQQQQHAGRPSSPVTLPEGAEPVSTLTGVVEKKARNLEKRKIRLTALEESKVEGKALGKDQLDAIEKLPEVVIQLELVKELQKQFSQLQTEFEKQKKKKDKLEKQQQKAAERETSRSLLKYSLRIQYLLANLGESAKECFRTGTEGAVEMTEAQLTQVDELYRILNPCRPDNPRYEKQLEEASEHMILLYEGSAKEVANTTYQALHDILGTMDTCGFFDTAREQEEEEEEEEEDEEDEEEIPPYAAEGEGGEVNLQDQTRSPAALLDQTPLNVSEQHSAPPTMQQHEYVSATSHPPPAAPALQSYPPAPSRPPDFAGLETENLHPISAAFTFMHDSAIDRTEPQQTSFEQLSTSPPAQPSHSTVEQPPEEDPHLVHGVSPVENGHQTVGGDMTQGRPGGREVPSQQTESRGGQYGRKYNSGYSRGGQRGRGPPRGGYSNREREGGYSNRERDYQRESGGSRGWSGGGGRYGGSNYGAKRGRSNHRGGSYSSSQNRTSKQ